MKLAIITGGSRGIGKALVRTFCENGFFVISIARRALDYNHKNLISHFREDLTHLETIDKLFVQIERIVSKNQYQKIILINNAGIIGDIKKVENLSNDAISKTIQINLTVPMVMSSCFLSLFKNKSDIIYRIINISSGASNSPYYGWSGYCSSKAGLEMFSKVLAKEEINNKNFKSLCIKPGVVDTDMQSEIRAASENDFKDVDRFIKLKKKNQLYSPDFSAKKILEIDQKDDYLSGVSIDIRDL
ncbi:MAG: hypothetical protein CL824_04320 [Crocinitomicaceae bacterium]|nr:hypothetical protein [Crocinitomicaceae bacterium]